MLRRVYHPRLKLVLDVFAHPALATNRLVPQLFGEARAPGALGATRLAQVHFFDALDDGPALAENAIGLVFAPYAVGVVAEKHAKADPEDPCQFGALLPGLLASHVRAEGEIVSAGKRLCAIEAMKMESSMTAPIGGRIKKIHVPAREQIDAGDLLFTIVPVE